MPVGPANRFESGGDDRGQPTWFPPPLPQLRVQGGRPRRLGRPGAGVVGDRIRQDRSGRGLAAARVGDRRSGGRHRLPADRPAQPAADDRGAGRGAPGAARTDHAGRRCRRRRPAGGSGRGARAGRRPGDAAPRCCRVRAPRSRRSTCRSCRRRRTAPTARRLPDPRPEGVSVSWIVWRGPAGAVFEPLHSPAEKRPDHDHGPFRAPGHVRAARHGDRSDALGNGRRDGDGARGGRRAAPDRGGRPRQGGARCHGAARRTRHDDRGQGLACGERSPASSAASRSPRPGSSRCCRSRPP